MIVPMKKYSFLVYHKEYESFLQSVQEIGVLHVIEKALDDVEDENLRDKYALIAQLSNAISFLEKRDIEGSGTSTDSDGYKVLSELQTLQKENDAHQQKLAAIEKDISAIEPWGAFSWDSIAKLNDAGIQTKFFIAPQRRFEEEIKDNFFVEEINTLSGYVYFVLVQKGDDTIEIDAEEAQLPEKSLKELNKLKTEINAILEKTESIFDSFAEKQLALLEKTKQEVSGQLAFDKVIKNTSTEADSKLMVLEGWTPKDKEEALNTYLETSGVYYEVASPEINENPPIKLKNNKFAKLYEAIGELYTFPNYGEIDLTPFFAPFYMLFFGFCLGDAGYGLLITLGCVYGLFTASKKVKPLLKLGMYLGIATTIMGVVGGTFFGIMLHPDDFESTKALAPWLVKYQGYVLSSEYLMYSALGLGYFQVLFGMFIKAANKARMYGFKHSISQLGWNIIVMISLPAYGLGMFEVLPVEKANQIALISLIIGAIPAFLYNTPGKNPLLNIGTGVWDTYQMASGLLGDVLSYIRLFALGLSSAILGNVFNTLAIDLSPDTIIVRQIVMVLILVIGHALNFFMAALGSFVHPLRLTFVEFYKNAGFMGGGSKYEPFKN